MKRLTLAEKLAELRQELQVSKRHNQNSWFFPSDLAHGSAIKYQCRKLYEAGLIERRGDPDSRWGYQYRITTEVKPE
jgi:hypothetical protein